MFRVSMRSLAVLLMSLTLLAPFTIPASAAPAEVPYRSSDCVQTDGGLLYCTQVRGVLKTNLTPSGNTLYVANEEFCYQLYLPNGEVSDSGCRNEQFSWVHRNGETQVYPGRTGSTSTYEILNEICTSSSFLVVANGQELRREVYFECVPIRE